MRWRAQIIFEERRDVRCLLHKMLPNLLGSQHLLEILQNSLIFKNSEKLVKSGCY